MMEEKLYCVEKGKYGLTIKCCEDGESWEKAVEDLVYFNNLFNSEGV